MKRTLAALLLLLPAATLMAQNPVASSDAVVVEGNARFTVLTDLPIDVMVIDMDWHHTWPHAFRCS